MAGRKQKYTIKELKDIIDSYFDINKNSLRYGKLTAEDLAQYARDKLHYQEIRYYHFTRRDEIKNIINEINSIINNYEISKDLYPTEYITLDYDIVKASQTQNDRVLKHTVRSFNESYKKLQKDVIDFDNRNKQLDIENAKLKEKLEDLELQNIQLKEEKKELQEIVENLKKFKSLNKNLMMLEQLKEIGVISDYDNENINQILIKAKIIKPKDNFIEVEVLNNNTIELQEDIKEKSKDEISNKISSISKFITDKNKVK